MPNLPVKANMLNVQSVLASIRSQLATDPSFKKTAKRDPVGALVAHGIHRRVAVNILANDLGVAVSSDWCICTGCCCSGCSFSGKGRVDLKTLPALNDAQAWKAFALKRS